MDSIPKARERTFPDMKGKQFSTIKKLAFYIFLDDESVSILPQWPLTPQLFFLSMLDKAEFGKVTLATLPLLEEVVDAFDDPDEKRALMKKIKVLGRVPVFRKYALAVLYLIRSRVDALGNLHHHSNSSSNEDNDNDDDYDWFDEIDDFDDFEVPYFRDEDISSRFNKLDPEFKKVCDSDYYNLAECEKVFKRNPDLFYFVYSIATVFFPSGVGERESFILDLWRVCSLYSEVHEIFPELEDCDVTLPDIDISEFFPCFLTLQRVIKEQKNLTSLGLDNLDLDTLRIKPKMIVASLLGHNLLDLLPVKNVFYFRFLMHLSNNDQYVNMAALHKGYKNMDILRIRNYSY